MEAKMAYEMVPPYVNISVSSADMMSNLVFEYVLGVLLEFIFVLF